ncbi:glycosyltransferase [Kineosporia sp. J2-2]|uniref:Glycosyltransferase n=1 Tax=Kineosporia corallincola TaxID=2835133 RepID=A0ABS5TL22_9ACTN|nr:glycosyltransferase [Kineosporia corallincola]MBT0770861.1 glycosyltransferase [Kineosporia corallincola]
MAALPPTRIGDVLVERGLLSQDDLNWAVNVQGRTGSRLGAILIAAGLVRRLDLYRTLARIWDSEFVDVANTVIDPELVSGLEPRMLVDEGWIPVRYEPGRTDGTVLVATAEEPSWARRQQIQRRMGVPVRLAVTSDWDIALAMRRVFREHLIDEAANGLWQRHPAASAREVLSTGQIVVLLSVAGGYIYGLLFAPLLTLLVTSMLVAMFFLVGVLFKFVVCLVGARREAAVPITDDDVAALTDDELPMYTVLVPVYREANIVADLIGNLGGLDYPPEKLEILLLLEEEDDETRMAAAAADCPSTITFVVVPKGGPQTKPKACNIGLFFAHGEFLVIYDAEDRPEADQLKKAVIAFRRAERGGNDKLVCVQAALNYWNAEENALTRMFTLEYSFWFDYMLPGLEALKLPIPLGGTSNHFRTQPLRDLGGWDPYNVTEDADLGIRAAALGYTVGVINSTTYEEANRAYGNWIRQRSRWIKGYLQTTLVHTRRPVRLTRQAGAVQALAFALLVGGTPLSFLLSPPLYAMFFFSLVLPIERMNELFPSPILEISLANLLLGNSVMIYVTMMGAFKRRRYRLVPWALLNPAYWMMHSISAYKALWQLITRPHYWEKTTHGLSGQNHQNPGG